VPLSAIVGGSSGPAITGPREAGGGEASFADTPTARSDGRTMAPVDGCTPIAEVRYRDRVRVAGRVRSIRVAPLHDAPVLELELDDGTAALSAVFLGRRRLPAVDVGSRMIVEGTVGLHRQRLAVLNPSYELRP
jgi:RecG-like helicase